MRGLQRILDQHLLPKLPQIEAHCHLILTLRNMTLFLVQNTDLNLFLDKELYCSECFQDIENKSISIKEEIASLSRS
jgi:hypothetical protein